MGAADRVWEVGDKRCGPSVRIHLYHAGDILPGGVVTEHETRRHQRGRIHRFAELDSVGSVHRHVDSPTRHARYYLLAGDKAKAEQLAKQATDANKTQVAPLAVYVEMLHANGSLEEVGSRGGKARHIDDNVKSITVSSTMGPGLKLDVAEVASV